MNKKRRPIRQRVQTIFLLVSVISLTLVSVVGSYSMFSIRDASSKALRSQLEINLSNSISDKATLSDVIFGKYEDAVNGFAVAIHDMYVNPQNYIGKEIQPPYAKNQGILTMQRYLRDDSVKIWDVRGEMLMLGNLELDWNTLIEQNKEIITTIYLGTESGLHIAYDESSQLGVEEGSRESHFDYSDSDWYTLARDTGKAGFTDIYQDSYGRGMMVSCYAPFYDKNGDFSGSVSMDILISDIYQQIVSMDVKDGNVLLIDRSGMTVDPQDANKLISVSELVKDENIVAALAKGENGFTIASDGVYYVYAPVEYTNWMLCIGIPESTVLESVYQMDSSILTAMIIFGVVFVLLIVSIAIVSHRFVKSLTEPLITLGNDAAVISGGNLDFRAEVKTNDEIGDLAIRFNEMAESLQKYVDDLTQVTAEKERIGTELALATRIQADMLPNIFPAFPERKDFDIYASMTPAKEVGGDFYDFFLIDNLHLGLVMADVSGKGVPAALFMMISKTILQNYAMTGYGPAQVLEKLNEQICKNNREEMFVTVWYGVLNLKTGHLVAANAGHEYPVIRRANGEFELLKDRHGFVIGGMDGVHYKEYDLWLDPGSSLFVYTDGVPEATNAENVLFGMERTVEALNADPARDPKSLLEGVAKAVKDFVGDAPQFDDLTMLGLNFFGPEKTNGELVLSAKVESIPLITDTVNEMLESLDCPMKAQIQIDVAIDEVFANIANYAYPNGEGKATVRFEPTKDPNGIQLTFIDSGIPFNPLEAKEPDTTLSAEDREIGGLGIFMVRKSMDDVQYEYKDRHNILRIRKYF